MTDHADTKHTNPVKLWLTDREFMDLTHIANAQDRKVADMGRVMLRAYMYGNVPCECTEVHRANRADEAL
jgi:hypothetical protein